MLYTPYSTGSGLVVVMLVPLLSTCLDTVHAISLHAVVAVAAVAAE